MPYQTPAPRYSRPIPASNLPPLEKARPTRRIYAVVLLGLAVFVAGCSITDTRSNAEKSYDACVQRFGQNPKDCAIGTQRIYRTPPPRA